MITKIEKSNYLNALIKKVYVVLSMEVALVSVTKGLAQFDISVPVPDEIKLPYFEGVLARGSIPFGVRSINTAFSDITELVEGSIPTSVTHLYSIRRTSRIYDGSIIDPSCTCAN